MTTRLLVLCTGNAARSVMAGAMLEHAAAACNMPLAVTTAGTHTLDGQPMSQRTRLALHAVDGLADWPVGRHRSHQLVTSDLVGTDLLVTMEADHVRYVRRHFPEVANRTATIRRLCRDLAPAPPDLHIRLDALGLAEVALEGDEDVADPAGKEADVYAECARELWKLCGELITLL